MSKTIATNGYKITPNDLDRLKVLLTFYTYPKGKSAREYMEQVFIRIDRINKSNSKEEDSKLRSFRLRMATLFREIKFWSREKKQGLYEPEVFRNRRISINAKTYLLLKDHGILLPTRGKLKAYLEGNLSQG